MERGRKVMDKKEVIKEIRTVVNSESFEVHSYLDELHSVQKITRNIISRSVDNTFKLLRVRVSEIADKMAEEKGITFEQAINEIIQELMEGKES